MRAEEEERLRAFVATYAEHPTVVEPELFAREADVADGLKYLYVYAQDEAEVGVVLATERLDEDGAQAHEPVTYHYLAGKSWRRWEDQGYELLAREYADRNTEALLQAAQLVCGYQQEQARARIRSEHALVRRLELRMVILSRAERGWRKLAEQVMHSYEGPVEQFALLVDGLWEEQAGARSTGESKEGPLSTEELLTRQREEREERSAARLAALATQLGQGRTREAREDSAGGQLGEAPRAQELAKETAGPGSELPEDAAHTEAAQEEPASEEAVPAP